jgi:two-component system cell cycle response regulator
MTSNTGGGGFGEDGGNSTANTTVIMDMDAIAGDAAGIQRRVPVLNEIQGVEKGRIFVLTGQSAYIIGRSRDCYVTIPDASCSRKHAEVIFQASNNQVFVKDLGSTNGTRVDGVVIAGMKALKEGDIIQIGDNAQFKYMLMTQKEADTQQDIYQQATHDALTKVFNRRFFEETLDREVARRNTLGAGLGVVILDVDFFKKVNDTYGHPAGDTVLKEIARRIPVCVRGEDIFARFGGEEFVVMAKAETLDTLKSMAERIRQTIEAKPIVHAEHSLTVTASVGAVWIEGTSKTPSPADMVKAADECLYEAKRTGRNRCVIKSL